MRVLHIYSGNLFGGVETLLITLARERRLCPEMEPHFALCFEGRLFEELKGTGVPVYLLEQVKISWPWTVWKARRHLRQLLKQKHFDIVICHSVWPQVVFGPMIKAHYLPFVFWCHDIPNGRHWLERLAKRIQPDLVITNSRYTQSSLPNLYPGIRSEVVYCPVSPLESLDRELVRRTIREEFHISESAVVIIQASRFEEWKGHRILISALGQLKELPNWICWIAGEAQRPHEIKYLRELKRQAKILGMENRIQFIGQRKDISHLLAAADIYCQPNLSPEPFGIIFVEALYRRLPVVTSKIGGATEIIDESCGKLVPPKDAHFLRDILKALILNPNQRSKISVKGSSRAYQLCNPAHQLPKLYYLLCGLIKQNVLV